MNMIIASTQGARRSQRSPANLLLLVFTTFLIISPMMGRATADFINGSFETGDFTGWTRSSFISYAGGPTTGAPTYETFLASQSSAGSSIDSNQVELLQAHTFANPVTPIGSDILPTEGRYLAFISNQKSHGVGTLTGSSISQTFTVRPEDSALSLDLCFLNVDRTISFARYDDFAGVALSVGSSIVAQYNLDLDPSSAANAHVIASAAAGGFLNSTPWQTAEFDLSPYVGQEVTLTAYVVNWRTNLNESRLLLDNVNIQPNDGQVPSPSSLILVVAGGIIVLGYTHRRR